MDKFTTPVPAGRVCFWYQGGDTHRAPRIALVTEDGTNGIISLTVFGPMWTRGQCESGVRHRDDPFLVKRPNHAKDNGCWDYLPGDKPPVPPPPQGVTIPTVEPKDQPVLDVKELIGQLATGGHSAIEIAAHLTETTDDKWSYQKVNAILRNMKPAEQEV